MPGDRGEERLQLLGGPGLGLDLGDRPEPWRVGDERDVPVDEPPLLGVGERTADDEVDLEDGLRCERPAPVGRAEHRLVERVELFGPQAPDRDPPEGREDVAFDLAAVAVEGRRGEVDLLAGQPAPCEVCAERERPGLVVATVALLRKAGGEALGLVSAGAGWVPAAALASGDRVEAFVDDGVPAGALLRDVSLHVDPPWSSDRGDDPVEGSVAASPVSSRRWRTRRRVGIAARRDPVDASRSAGCNRLLAGRSAAD